MNRYQRIAYKCAKLTKKRYMSLSLNEAKGGRDYLLIFKNDGWDYARIKRFKDFLSRDLEVVNG
jgi:hypothetical protein